MTIDQIQKAVLQRQELSIDHLLYMLSLHDDDLPKLFELADGLNREIHNDRVSFVLNRNINYTNVCALSCAFCAYHSQEGQTPFLLKPEEIVDRLKGLDITEVSIQGGLHPKVMLSDICAMIRAIKVFDSSIHIHGFSPMEIFDFARKEKISTHDVLDRLVQNGLDSLCGTAAEILDDDLRAIICKDKLSADEWSEIITSAHRKGIASTATMLFGHIENIRHIAEHMFRLRTIQKETNGFTEFIPLPFIPYNTQLGAEHDIDFVGLRTARKITACARVFFYGFIDNIQTSWVKLGFEGALSCLNVGANDLGGTLYEENITRTAGGAHGEYVSKDHFNRAIRSLGKSPVVRDTIYSFQKIEVGV